MRTLGPGSISSFLKIILDVTWYALWALIAVLALTAVASLLLAFNPEILSKLAFESGSRRIELSPPTLAAGLVAIALYMAGVVLIVGTLRKLFTTLTAGDPFHPDNVARLRLIGLILAGLELGRYLFWIMAAVIMPGVNRAEVGLNLTTWFSVMVVFVLAEVFREGARLRRDAELTI
ncbi:MAG: DUF2975 domain-containing protein [Caulobacter sp.]|jgi:hypothetical protein